MKKLLTKVVLATALCTTAQAGALVDLKAGYDLYPSVTPSGTISGIDIVSGAGVSKAEQTGYYVEFEHFIPLIPNVKFEERTLTFTGTATVNIPNTVITASSPSIFSWDHQDAIFYWGVPFSTWLPMIDAADFGFGLKLGNMLAGITNVSETKFPLGAPYGYARLHITPPLLFGLGFEAEVKYISATYKSAELSFAEYVIKADWFLEAPIPVIDIALGVEAGYRTTSLKATIDSAAFNLGFEGVFFGVVGKFGI